jgi:hypothetical protein
MVHIADMTATAARGATGPSATDACTQNMADDAGAG